MPDRKLRNGFASFGRAGSSHWDRTSRSRPTNPSSQVPIHRLYLFVLVSSGLFLVLCVASEAAQAIGMSTSTVFGAKTPVIALGAAVVWTLTLWLHGSSTVEDLRGFQALRSATASSRSAEIPRWLAWTSNAIHYPAMLAAITGISLLLGDSKWIEEHTHSESWATKLAGLAVLATVAYTVLAARRIHAQEKSRTESNARWRSPRGKNV